MGPPREGRPRAEHAFGPAHYPCEHAAMSAKAPTPSSLESAPALEPYYTIAEIAAHYKTGREQVHRWIRAGDLRAERIGRLVRVRPKWLMEFHRRHVTPVRAERH
jgi:excisionase family DNA binding protein